MARKLPLILGTLLVTGLALHAYNQDLRIARLRADLEAVRAATGTGETLEAAPPGPAPAARTEVSATAASPTPAVAPPAAAPRAPVSQAEINRVESAVLSLLESDRPELRAKLREVVDEQRAAEEQERDERGRERYMAATEARLAELSGPAALSPEQRHAIVDILVANRDQMIDIMRNAETAEAFASGRAKVEKLREESDARVKALLNATQYEAYKQTQEREFGWGMGGPGRSAVRRRRSSRGSPRSRPRPRLPGPGRSAALRP